VPQRLAKVIAWSGVASRRRAEELVRAGRVKVNGIVAEHPGHPVEDSDAIAVDDTPIVARESGDNLYLLFHKPKGLVTTRSDERGRKTIFDHLGPLPARVESVGRLDLDTEGVLLLTNDGPLAHRRSCTARRRRRRSAPSRQESSWTTASRHRARCASSTRPTPATPGSR
jgi:23S rRNA pseudouridine2605 synthase